MPCPQSCPESVYVLMSRCWEAEPTKRPSFKEIFEELEKISAIVKSEALDNNSSNNSNNNNNSGTQASHVVDVSSDLYVFSDNVSAVYC